MFWLLQQILPGTSLATLADHNPSIHPDPDVVPDPSLTSQLRMVSGLQLYAFVPIDVSMGRARSRFGQHTLTGRLYDRLLVRLDVADLKHPIDTSQTSAKNTSDQF
ncbi:uncharacterized protein RSE6_04434 [Rhynchosporium secalis]|uniref:Uncharacterized protein n=1 Tax=Rhynchosporium secalis TaxID=38038 RepID=A0A1E1M5A1_RHYSE|nr:uncharacterized protein RSE6_04434 [Rhynchosporium secalis]